MGEEAERFEAEDEGEFIRRIKDPNFQVKKMLNDIVSEDT